MPDDPIARFFPTLRALHNWLSATQTPYLIIGGVAVSLVARSRATRDIDVVILTDESKLKAFIDSGAAFGFAPRIADPLKIAEDSRLLLLAHQPTRNKLDVMLGALPFEKESIARGTTFRIGDLQVRVPTVEDLVIMKAVASRPADWADLDTLLDIHPQVDRRRVRRWVRRFADVLEDPEIMDRLEQLLARRRAPAVRKKKRRGKHK